MIAHHQAQYMSIPCALNRSPQQEWNSEGIWIVDRNPLIQLWSTYSDCHCPGGGHSLLISLDLQSPASEPGVPNCRQQRSKRGAAGYPKANPQGKTPPRKMSTVPVVDPKNPKKSRKCHSHTATGVFFPSAKSVANLFCVVCWDESVDDLDKGSHVTFTNTANSTYKIKVLRQWTVEELPWNLWEIGQ